MMSTCPKKPSAFRTRDGFQLYIDRFSAIDTNLLAYFPRDVLYRHRIYVQELRAQERHQIYNSCGLFAGITAISDLTSASFGHLTGNVMTQVGDATKMDTANYPETMRKVIMVNTPSFFSSLWSIASYLWDEEQKKKNGFSWREVSG